MNATILYLKEHKRDLFCILILILFNVLTFYRNQFGFDWSDETFYPTVSYRLLIGDHLFENMWSVSQFGAALLMPLMAAYKYICGDMDGIIFFFREVQHLFSLFLALYSYFVFRKKGNRLFVVLASVAIIVFTPGCIASLSYNTLGLQFLLLSWLLIARYLENKRNFNLMGSGICFGFACQMYPGIVLAILIIPIYLFYGKERYGINDKWHQRLKWWVLGGTLVICVFLVALLWNSSLDSAVEHFHRIFNTNLDGYENRSANIFTICCQYLCEIRDLLGYSAYILTGFTVLCFLYPIFTDSDVKTFKTVLSILWALITVWIWAQTFDLDNINYINLPLALTGPALWGICGRKNNICTLLYILGIFESLSVQIGSNNRLAGSSYGLFLCSIAVILYIALDLHKAGGDFFDKETVSLASWGRGHILNDNRIRALLIGCICCVIVGSLAYYRMTWVYRDAPLSTLTARLESGPGKGIYTAPMQKERYEVICKEIKENLPKEGTVLFSKLLPFGYLLSDLRPASMTTFRAEIASEELREYYKVHANLVPDRVFVMDEDVGISNEDNPIEGYLGSLLLSEMYQQRELTYMTVYIKQ